MTPAGLPIVTSLSGFELSIRHEKLGAYLLNPRHVTGGSKAAYFLALGFSLSRPDEFMDALVAQAWASRQITCRPHPRGYGMEIGAVGPIRAPDGRSSHILTAWNWNPETAATTSGAAPKMMATFVTARPA